MRRQPTQTMDLVKEKQIKIRIDWEAIFYYSFLIFITHFLFLLLISGFYDSFLDSLIGTVGSVDGGCGMVA